MSKEMINDESLDRVVGGYMNFNYNTQKLKYRHEETKVTTYYNIKDFENAWKLSNQLHSQNLHEDVIIARLIDAGYIEA